MFSGLHTKSNQRLVCHEGCAASTMKGTAAGTSGSIPPRMKKNNLCSGTVHDFPRKQPQRSDPRRTSHGITAETLPVKQVLGERKRNMGAADGG